ncbi:hypothetical protein [Streptomyces sp. MBT33]|uniref:hypothetical protein n=1 Tax=Streptomyces sp. MBT33 TaxID=1488363 RepID=UPI00190E3888|nr:hypothetical protein [Streptomyces sp. MBT33]MBK3640036.1 hypothetical protein [Streptomyces sp. MBT33]
MTRTVLVTAASTVAALVIAAPSASATPHTVHIKGGHTSVTVAPAIAKALLSNGIAPIVTRPGKPSLTTVGGQPTLKATYPITGGSLTANPLGGKIKHSGGLKFTNVFNGRSLEVKNFTIDLTKGRLTGLVAGTKTRVPVFKLDLSTAHVKLGKHKADATNVTLKLTKEAAGALNSTLKTKVFSTGLTVGTADTHPHF